MLVTIYLLKLCIVLNALFGRQMVDPVLKEMLPWKLSRAHYKYLKRIRPFCYFLTIHLLFYAQNYFLLLSVLKAGNKDIAREGAPGPGIIYSWTYSKFYS